MSYYEKWITALESLMIKAELVSADELSAGRPAPDAVKASPPLTADGVGPVMARGGPTDRRTDTPAKFGVGDIVRARNINPAGHTRLPRYARGHLGTVIRAHGAHVFPDANAHGLGECPQPLYQVRFEADELWGPNADRRSRVYLDLWEDYLEPA